MYLNYTQKTCEIIDLKQYQKNDIAFNSNNQQIQLLLSHKNPYTGKQLNTLAVVDIGSCTIKYYEISLDDDILLSKKLFSQSIVYLNYGIYLYVYDLESQLGKFLNEGIFFEAPIRLYENYLFLINQGILYIYQTEQISIYRNIDLNPQSILDFSFCSELNYLIVLIQNELTIYDFLSMKKIKAIAAYQKIIMFTNKNSSQIYIIETNQLNSNQIRIIDLQSLQITNQVDLPQNEYYLNYQYELDEISNQVFTINYDFTFMAIDLRLVQNQLQPISHLYQSLYITGQDESQLKYIYSKNANYFAITEDLKTTDKNDSIDEYYNLDQQGILAYIDSLNNKYKQIMYLNYTKFHMVVKKVYNNHYTLVANDFQIFCFQKDLILDTYTIQSNFGLSNQPYLLSNQENIFMVANNTIFDIQYSFDSKQIILYTFATLSRNVFPIDIISKANNTAAIYAYEKILYLSYSTKTITYQIEGNVFYYFQKLKHDMFAAVTDIKLLIYSLDISASGVYSLVMKCKIINNDTLQFYLMGTNDLIVSEDSLKRIALYQFDQVSQTYFEYQSIPYPCYSGNKFLLSSQNTNYFALSCSLQTNIYKNNQKPLLSSLPTILKETSSNYYTVVKTFKGIKMNQFLILQQYIFCTLQQKIIILDLVSLSKIYEINLTNFIFLKLMYLGVDQTYDKFSIKGVQDYQRINFKFLINNSTQINDIDQIQLPLCYINIKSNLTRKDQISLLENLQMYKNTLNQQVQKIILQITLIDKVQLIEELQSDAYELKVFQDESSQNKIQLTSLFSIKKQNIQYSGVSFQFPDNLNLTIQNKKKVAIQNSQFSSNTFNSGVFFQNIDQLVISNITINVENILNKNISNQAFIILSNISDVVFQKFSVTQLKKFQFRYFLVFNQIINSLFISDTIISNILCGNELYNFISIRDTNYLQIEKFKAFDIISSQGQYQKAIFDIEGVQNSILNTVYGNNLQNISFFFYTNSYFQKGQKVYLTNDNLTFKNMNISNAKYRNSLFWIYSNNFSLIGENNIFSNIINLNAEGGVFKIQGSNVNITNSYFANNQAAKGGAINLISIDYQASFQNCTFEKNKAMEFGGAIHLVDTFLFTENTTIRYNEALIGGGIYYNGFKPINTDISFSNNAEIYGKNIASNLLYCKTNIICDEKCNIDIDSSSTTISNFRSGSTLNFFFEIIDEENNQIIINKQKLNNYPDEIQKEIAKIKISAIADYQDLIKLSNQQSISYVDYNEDTKLFRLPNLQVVGNPIKNQKIELISSFTQIQYGQNQTSNNYTIYFNFRKCQTGERQVSIDNIIQCIPCPNGFYSLVTTQNQSSVECTICPPSAYHCEKDIILLKEGYWRSNENTDNIYYCVNKPSNCKGSLEGNRLYCDEGKVGPLCESCDIYEKVWDTKYMKSGKYDCIKCNDVQNKTFVLPIIGIFIFILAYVVFSINMSIKMSKQYSYSYYFRMSRILVSNRSSMQDISSFYFKIILNYIQISLITNSYYLTLPPILSYFPDILSLPLQHFLNIFDCQFSKIDEDTVSVVFLRVLWSYILPFIFMLIIVIVYSILFCIQKCLIKYKDNKTLQHFACINVTMNSSKKMMVYHLYNGLFFLLIFMQPSQVQILLSTISCKEIDNKMYIATDLTFQCYTNKHVLYVGTMVIPGLLLWIFVIPLVILYLLKKQSNRLDSLQVRFSFGFLYQEYKQKYYFWEFVKSYFKIGIVLIGTFLAEAKVAKLIIICLVLFVYQYITSRVKPYILIKLNKLDFLQINVLVVIALFNAFIEHPPSEISKNLVIVLTIIIHNSFLLINIFIALFLKIEAKFSMQVLKLKLFLKARIPFLFKYMVIKKPINLLRVNKNWKKVIEFVEKISFRNNLQNILEKGQKQIKKSTLQNNLQFNFQDQTLDFSKQNHSSKSISSPYKKSSSISELFQFNGAAKFMKKNSLTSRKSIRNVNSLSDIKEEDSQFDAFKIARSQSIVQSDCLINQPDQIDFKQPDYKKQDQVEQNQYNQAKNFKKSSIDNTSYIGDENQKVKHSSKNLLQSQQDNNPSFNSIQNSQSATKKNKTLTQRGFLSRFMNSQSRQTTQPGTPSELLISHHTKKQAETQNVQNNKSIKSTDDFMIQLQRIDQTVDKERANQFSNIDLINSRIAFSNSNFKNIQSLENSLNFNQAVGSQSNFCSQQEKIKTKKVKNQIKYTSSSSEESFEEQPEQIKNVNQFQQINQFDLQISHYQNKFNDLISPSELVDNTIPSKFQYQNMTLDLQKESQVNQPELNPKNIFIPIPNVLSKLSIGESIQLNSKRSLNNMSPDIQQIELINFEQTPKKKSEQNNNELVNFEDSQSSNND
ncbi:transmembrane protein, putative (macronuclear) [Tetrahymena thermophila SB210]|uniref:Transmembrane protein, putative n=1 Tax=Tetrahymena thermophila (strain SB210) TaxID=312017 RepID=I7MJV1_TETTS|nr:transmembrane protein, putative [Tetrahymena thermophila SB210]EAS07524.2 transmembrane protein, putative [Tetrahymena thermophila SB210]|eukprot:XP_001027766.2 transmembrane protein, putative [Tetrahymena thermophila SB210]